LQLIAIIQQENIPPPINDEVISLTTLPPYKIVHKITSLQNKLICESERQVSAKSKYSAKKFECNTAEQELWQEKKVSNKLINIKKKANEVLEATRVQRSIGGDCGVCDKTDGRMNNRMQ
jgi:hypothetical protein